MARGSGAVQSLQPPTRVSLLSALSAAGLDYDVIDVAELFPHAPDAAAGVDLADAKRLGACSGDYA